MTLKCECELYEDFSEASIISYRYAFAIRKSSKKKKKKALQYIVTDVFPSPSLNVVHKPFPKLPSTLSFT